MENIEKAIISFTKELPQNTTVIQQEHTEQYSKVSMTVPLGGSKIPTKIKNDFFKMQQKIVVLFILSLVSYFKNNPPQCGVHIAF